MTLMLHGLLVAAALALTACTTPQPTLPTPLELPKKVAEHSVTQQAARAEAATQVTPIPAPPKPERTESRKPPAAPRPAGPEEANITLSFEQMPLPSFIQLVYATTLKRNVNIDPKVAARKDLVTLRTGAPQTPAQVADVARLLLKSYGIAVLDFGGLVRIVPDTSQGGYMPEIIRGRALPETPLPLRPIFQLVELSAVKNADVAVWLRNMFAKRIEVRDYPTRNAVMLSGTSDNVTAALEAIHVLDQPAMRGRHGARINPAFWPAEELAKKLTEVLQAEGYAASTSVANPSPVTLLPVAGINAIIVFTASQTLLDHVTTWARALDKPSERATGRSLFSYQVKNTSAEALAKTLEKLMSGQAVAAAVAPGAKPPARPAAPNRVVVDPGSNTIIFQGSSEDFGQIRSLLQELDRPARAALIEVTVAEIALKDNLDLGIEWLIKEAHLGESGSSVLSLGGGGLRYTRLDSLGAVRLAINALASSNRATILSNPRVVARNGESATIQVGQEVPIITAQQSTAVPAPAPGGGTTGTILQSVQYRNTGVILNVKPVIHAGDQIDLEISQEVSAAESTTTGVSTSPTFSQRRVQTRLSLRSGSTVLLGGLISSNRSDGHAGVPLLKDLPILGHLFRTDTQKSDRTELIVLITPYIISDDDDAKAITEAFRRQLGGWARPEPAESGKPSPPAAPAK